MSQKEPLDDRPPELRNLFAGNLRSGANLPSQITTTPEDIQPNRQAMMNPSTGTTGSATLIPNHRSDPADFGGLESYLEQAAWSKLNQARGAFMAHMDREGLDCTEKAWESALLAMADKIRGDRISGNLRALGKMIRDAYATDNGDLEKTA